MERASDESTIASRSDDGGNSDGENGMLSGYGYFDAGSFKHLLDKRKETEKSAATTGSRGRKAVGRKLRLAEYC